MQLNEVFYLFWWLIIVYITRVVYLWLSENSNVVYREKGHLDSATCTITQRLKLGTLLNAKSFSHPRFPDFALTSLSYGFYFDVDGQQRKFFAAFWAFSLMLLENFIWRFKLRAFI
jgi:hypothetical protein